MRPCLSADHQAAGECLDRNISNNQNLLIAPLRTSLFKFDTSNRLNHFKILTQNTLGTEAPLMTHKQRLFNVSYSSKDSNGGQCIAELDKLSVRSVRTLRTFRRQPAIAESLLRTVQELQVHTNFN